MSHPNRSRRKPRVTLKCPADVYAGPHERIVEFSHLCRIGGVFRGSPSRVLRAGLISLAELEDGTLQVSLYQLDSGVRVSCPELTRLREAARRVLEDCNDRGETHDKGSAKLHPEWEELRAALAAAGRG